MLFEPLVLALLVLLVLRAFYRDRTATRWKEYLVGQFTTLQGKVDTIMTQNERLVAAIKQIDDATNNIAGDLRGLKAKLEAAGVDETALATLENSAAALEALGAETPDEPPTT